MPKQNRVNPSGNIIATTARGTLMGNRGCLHDDQGQIKRLYQSKRWIICQLAFKGRHRQVMAPGRYTELFFLDEATALAAGHRPCAECLYPRFKLFCALWTKANPRLVEGPKLAAGGLDAVLHDERLTTDRRKKTYAEQLDRLPPGAFITLEPDEHSYLVLEDTLLAWHPSGYGPPIQRLPGHVVQVLTPRSVVNALAQGYPAMIHPSAFIRQDKD